MSTLGFPTYAAGTNQGATYTLNGVTYTWSGYAWYKTNQGAIAATTITGGTIVIGTGTQTVIINNGTITINGSSVITTSSLAATLTSGTDISIVYSTATQKITISDTSTFQTVTNRGSTTTNRVFFTNTSNSTTTNTGAVVISGGVGIGKDVQIGGRMYSESVQIADAIFDSMSVPVSNAFPTLVDSYPVTQFRSAEYLIQIDDPNNGAFQTEKLIMLVYNTGTSYGTAVSPYGLVTNAGQLGDWSTQINTGTNPPTAELYITMYYTSAKTVNVLRTALVA
jgi:hypothetical protein